MVKREDSNQGETKTPGFYYGWFIALVSAVVIVVAWGTYRTFGVFFAPVLHEFGWTRTMVSGAFSLSTFLNGFISIIIGRLTDRFGPRVVVTACGFFLGLGYLLMSQVKSIWQLYFFFGIIIAIGMSAAYIPLVSTAARWFVKRRALMTGIVISGMGVGMIIMAPVASRLIQAYGWSISYVVVGIIAMVSITVAAQFLRRDPAQVGLLPYGVDATDRETPGVEARGYSLKQAVYTRQFWMVFAMFLCLLFSLETVMVHVVIDATGYGVSAIDAANIISILGGLSIAGKIIMGGVADRIGCRKVLFIGFMVVSITLAILAVANELWKFYLFAAIFGFFYGGLITVFPPIVAELFGLTSHGVITGIVLFGGTIGGAIGPVLVGRIFDVTGSYHLGFLVCACVSVMGIVLASLLRPIITRGDQYLHC